MKDYFILQIGLSLSGLIYQVSTVIQCMVNRCLVLCELRSYDYIKCPLHALVHRCLVLCEPRSYISSVHCNRLVNRCLVLCELRSYIISYFMFLHCISAQVQNETLFNFPPFYKSWHNSFLDCACIHNKQSNISITFFITYGKWRNRLLIMLSCYSQIV